MKTTLSVLFAAALAFSCQQNADHHAEGEGHEHHEGHEHGEGHSHEHGEEGHEHAGADQVNFGIAVNGEGAIPVAELEAAMNGADSLADLTIKGKVAKVCQMKGCWMELEKEDGSTIRVTFKDYKLFMPKDLAGKEVVMHGKAMVREQSVETLRHYAKDAGKSEAEIAAITEPQVALAFEADGVEVK
jgi:hypothetical protein